MQGKNFVVFQTLPKKISKNKTPNYCGKIKKNEEKKNHKYKIIRLLFILEAIALYQSMNKI